MISDWQRGTVRWFDNMSGEGVIKDSLGKSHFVHYSAIQSNQTWKTLESGQSVEIQIVEHTAFTQISKVRKDK